MKATQGKKELRSGITTGACAAGAAYAAAKFLLTGELAGLVVVYNPQEMPIEIPIDSVVRTSDGARAVVIKDGGDDPDVTHGMEVVAEVKLAPGGELILEGGPGVGVVTKPGLQVPVGQPAINPVPEKMIRDALACFVTNTQGLVVTISVPGGDKVAVRTLNPRLGIQGGISILGTTGIVHPMSEEAFKDSLVPLIAQAVSLGHESLVLVPGRMSWKQAVEQFGFDPDAVVEMSNFVGFMLECCCKYEIKRILLWGHIGKLSKVAGGIFHTHSKVADGRREVIAANAALCGANVDFVKQIMEANTLEGMISYIKAQGFGQLFHVLAEKASQRAKEHVYDALEVGTVMLSMDGQILGLDQAARDIGRMLGCTKLP